MGKMRIHELAKELNIESREIIEFLEQNGIKDKKPASSLEEEEAGKVRSRFGRKAEAGPAEEKKEAAPAPSAKEEASAEDAARQAAAPSNAAGKAENAASSPEKKEEPVKKKRKLLAVFHPQNVSGADGRRGGRGGQAGGRDRRPDGDRRGQAPGRGGRESQPGRDFRNDRGNRNGRGQQAGRDFRTGDGKGRNERNVPRTPLVKVPRPHPVVRDEDIMNRPTAAQQAQILHEESQKKAQAAEAARKAAEEAEAAAKAAAEEAARKAAEEAAKAAEEAEKAARAAREAEESKKAQQAQKADSRKPARDSRPGRDGRKPSDGGQADRNKRGQRPGDKERGVRDQEGGKGRFARGANPADSGDSRGKDKAYGKDKDRNRSGKDRDGKYSGDRRNQGGRGRNTQEELLPKALKKPVNKPKEEKKEVITEIKIPEKLTIKELAEAMKMSPAVIIKKLFMDGRMMTMNQEITFDEAETIAMDYDIVANKEEQVDVIEELLKEDEEDEKDLVPRPPVVCVMGHVDHGKTSLLDAIRHSKVTDREAGGITQNIGAYVVNIDDRKITFLDTPGHEAFTAMRMRGANSTDIAVLVVAADDGVMPQTVEAINHAKAAGVEIIVAVNKIDKPSANVERVKQELTEYGLVAEDWGGQTIFCPVSAKTHEGIDNLLEMILLTADVMELKANPDRNARGLVLEAKLDKGKGPVANVLVQKGTLHVGDYIACGACSGKVRAMMDENSRRVKAAGPSTPVEVLGLSDVPSAGEVLVATDTDKDAKNFAATFVTEEKNKLIEDTKSRMSLDDLFSQIQTGNLKELELIVKADVQGSVEALRQALEKLSNDEVHVRVIHGGVGAINESDITLAAASNAIVIGFNVRPDAPAKALADQEKVDVRLYRVIYQAIDDIEAAMKGMLEPIYEEKIIGHAEVRQLFKASGVGTIAGSYVLDGSVQRGCKVRVYRDDKQLFEGNLASLKRFKDDAREVKAGYECGLVIEGFNELQEGDRVEAAIMVEVPRT